MESVTISVIIPVYNGAEFLEECLESILKQEIPRSTTDITNLEHVDGSKVQFLIELSIYDDASTDSSPEIIERWRVKLKEQESTVGQNEPIQFSLKTGRNATGKPQGGIKTC